MLSGRPHTQPGAPFAVHNDAVENTFQTPPEQDLHFGHFLQAGQPIHIDLPTLFPDLGSHASGASTTTGVPATQQFGSATTTARIATTSWDASASPSPTTRASGRLNPPSFNIEPRHGGDNLFHQEYSTDRRMHDFQFREQTADAHSHRTLGTTFGSFDDDGSFVPRPPGLSATQIPPPLLQSAHGFGAPLHLTVPVEPSPATADESGVRKAFEEEEDGHEVVSAPKRRRGRNKSKPADTEPPSSDAQVESGEPQQRKPRASERHADADASASTSAGNPGPSVQGSNNDKPGAKPRTACGRALENTNELKRDKIQRLFDKIMSAKTIEEALQCLPGYSETPTDGDLDSFKAELKKVVGGHGTESSSTCASCWDEFGVHVPLPATATPSKHTSDYHRGLRTCPACRYLLIHRGTNGAQRHRTWCPVWLAVVARGIHEEWLRRCGVLAKPSSQFFSEKAVKSAEKAAKGDSVVREDELLAWLKKETSKLKLPQADKLTPAIADGEREEGATGASGAFATDGHAEYDEDADGEYDLDDDYIDASTSGARSNDDSVPTVAPRGSADAGSDSTAGRPSNAGAALVPSLRWGSSSSVRSTEDVRNDGVYSTSRAARNDAESAVGYGDWADVDPVERTNIDAGWGGISVASNSAHDVALPIDDGASFDDAMATVGDYVW
ncbi:hypothetical protein EXIGLDRAFT_775384 [Exidia glandulosa HHB12029]|uniref:Uncharacterized protein n=1 Tax=Exidia glandulosa HHB12029 TaxID=1314781 RepID=A0A165DXJ6_EXIGL|nr:hypothetical protein EXIGLDRAFT_775384 [Exidia glandulosa HHB12029]